MESQLGAQLFKRDRGRTGLTMSARMRNVVTAAATADAMFFHCDATRAIACGRLRLNDLIASTAAKSPALRAGTLR
ncbi:MULTISPECIES: hypothetical protein [unclassified Paraburkholderia]|uniref:hypothetical protein n=1 Tax=unclassified Paraburkholderia TaxID=2615204 RepID=UPI0038B9353A